MVYRKLRHSTFQKWNSLSDSLKLIKWFLRSKSFVGFFKKSTFWQIFKKIDEKYQLMWKKFFGSKYDHTLSFYMIYIMIATIGIVYSKIKICYPQMKISKYDENWNFHIFWSRRRMRTIDTVLERSEVILSNNETY